MGRSILQLQIGSRQRAGGSTIRAVNLASRGSGAAGAAGVAIATVTCALVTMWWLPVTARVLGTALALVVLGAAALVDVAERRLPNRLVVAALVPVVVTVAVSWSSDVLRDVVAGAALVGVPLLVTHLVSPAGMGFGDVKAGAVLGAALGLLSPQLALFALVLGLATGAICGLVRGARSIPLGPALVAGALAALVAGHLLDPKGLVWT